MREGAYGPRTGRRRPLAALLADRGVCADEDEARRWIMAGQVLVDGQRIDKPGTPVLPEATVLVRGRRQYASRGGFKLAAALDHYAVPVAGCVALDCGASTGGFTDCLLQSGARYVYAVEAGYGQLVGRLRTDPRVRNMERTNLGQLGPELFDPRPDLATLDLSYLSLTAALPQLAPLLTPAGQALALFKPLFEVADPVAGRVGRVSDPAMVVDALARALDAASSAGFSVLGVAKLALRPRHGVGELIVYLTRELGLGAWRWDKATLSDIVNGPGIGPVDAD